MSWVCNPRRLECFTNKKLYACDGSHRQAISLKSEHFQGPGVAWFLKSSKVTITKKKSEVCGKRIRNLRDAFKLWNFSKLGKAMVSVHHEGFKENIMAGDKISIYLNMSRCGIFRRRVLKMVTICNTVS